MNDKDVFMHVNELGDLYLYDVLLTYIYPRVFVCEDLFDCKYLFYEMSSMDRKDVWLVSRISKNEYYSLVDRKISIQEAYINKNGYNLFSLSIIYSDAGDVTELSSDIETWIKELPEDPVFSEKETADDISERTLKAARDADATVFDIRLFAGTDRHFIPNNFMSDLCNSFTSLTNSVFGQRRKEPLGVATSPGSCVISFSFPGRQNLLGENDAGNEMNIINEVLASETIYAGLSKVKDPKGFIRAYSKILNTIRKTGSDVQFTTASPNSAKVQKIELSKESVASRYEEIKDIYSVANATITVTGTLIALDSGSKRFRFALNDGKIISGTVIKDFFESDAFTLPEKYEAVIDVEKYFNDQHSCSKEKFCLKKLTVCS
ncbi:MAG: DUF6575 domain-containing protein [Bullifex sp.]